MPQLFDMASWLVVGRERLPVDLIGVPAIQGDDLKRIVSEYNTRWGIFCGIRLVPSCGGWYVTCHCTEHADCRFKWKHRREGDYHCIYSSGQHSTTARLIRGHSVAARKLAKQVSTQKPLEATVSLMTSGVDIAELPSIQLMRRARATHLHGATTSLSGVPVRNVCSWVSFLDNHHFKSSISSFRWEVLPVDPQRLPGTVVFIAPAFVMAARQLIERTRLHSKDSHEMYIVIDVTWKTTSSGWGWWKMALGGKSTSARTSLPCTTLVELALGRIS